MQVSGRVAASFCKRAVFWLCFGSLPFLLSCAAPTLRNQFGNYNEAYADALNQQMLLNLARLENGHPAYSLVFGSINNKYTFGSQTGVGTTGNITDTKTTVDNSQVSGGVLKLVSGAFTKLFSTVFGYSANETITSTSNPEFQFIPVNNETAARQVLEPISTDVFLQLYQQGYPIDQLLRIMIERIETPRLPSGEHLVLMNSPTCGTREYYERFLRACAILRTLQMHGFLSLETRAELEPLGPVSFGSSGQGGRGGQGTAAREGGPDAAAREYNPNPVLKDFTDAEDKSMLLRTNVNGGWQIYHRRAVPKFFLRLEQTDTATNAGDKTAEFTPKAQREEMDKFVNTIMEFVKTNQTVCRTNDYSAITNVVLALRDGIAIQTGVGTSGGANVTRLVLRSFNRAMEAVASEQAGFEALAKSDVNFTNVVPDFERRPILQMIWPDKNVPLLPPLQVVRYAGKTYQITDRKADPLDPTARWNRDVFRLMVALGSQVTVDISKFQRQVLELSQ